MANVTIKKAKIKDSLFLTAEYSEVIAAGTKSISEDFTAPVHEDLKRAFKKLTIHLRLLTGQVNEATGKSALHADYDPERTLVLFDPDMDFQFTEKDWDIIDSLYCAGFSIGGSGDSEGVTLIGRRTIREGKVLNLVSPFQKWENDSFDYPHSSELSQVIAECIGEVKLYLFEGKHQPDIQISLFDQEAEGDDKLTEQERMDLEMPLNTEMVEKAKKHRKKNKTEDIGIGIELNPSCFADGVKYCRDAEALKLVPTLFDVLNETAA